VFFRVLRAATGFDAATRLVGVREGSLDLIGVLTNGKRRRRRAAKTELDRAATPAECQTDASAKELETRFARIPHLSQVFRVFQVFRWTKS
jgi:hypothetical protein